MKWWTVSVFKFYFCYCPSVSNGAYTKYATMFFVWKQTEAKAFLHKYELPTVNKDRLRESNVDANSFLANLYSYMELPTYVLINAF